MDENINKKPSFSLKLPELMLTFCGGSVAISILFFLFVEVYVLKTEISLADIIVLLLTLSIPLTTMYFLGKNLQNFMLKYISTAKKLEAGDLRVDFDNKYSHASLRRYCLP